MSQNARLQSIATSSRSPTVTHLASSRRLEKACAQPLLPLFERRSQQLPGGDYSVVGEAFEVDFNRKTRTKPR